MARSTSARGSGADHGRRRRPGTGPGGHPVLSELVSATAWALATEAGREAPRPVVSDPDAFVRHARHHLVVPVLAPVLDELDLPDDAREDLATVAAAQTLRNLHTAAALAEIAHACDAADLPMLVLKGLPLSLRTTGELSGRHPGDLDVLLEPDRIDDAVEILADMGWDRPAGRANGVDPSWRRWLRFVFNQVVVTGDGRPPVELHWRLESTVATRVGFAELWGRREPVEIGGAQVPALGEVDEMAYTVVHAGRHRLERLKWAVDVARLVDRRPDLIGAAFTRAHEWDATRCFHEAFQGVRALRLLDPGADPDPSVFDPLEKFPLMRFRYGLVERPADKVRMLGGYVAPQPALDDERVPEPLALAAAPFRQLWRGVRPD